MYKKILVPLDGSKLAECILDHVASISIGCHAKEVVFLTVMEPFHMPSGADSAILNNEKIKQINTEIRAEAENYLKKMIGRIKYEGVAMKSEVITGNPAEIIIDYATENEIDLIAIATHGRSGVSRWVWGSVADRVLRSVCIPVLMVRAPGCVPGV
jgi:nucleotide-binding universal stress UspA family protein